MNIPCTCPSCESELTITELSCPECKTSVRGSYVLPDFLSLSGEEAQVLRAFLAARGKIKEMEKILDLSYPTVKSRLEAMLAKLNPDEAPSENRKGQFEIIEKLQRGEITEQEAKRQMKELIIARHRGHAHDHGAGDR